MLSKSEAKRGQLVTQLHRSRRKKEAYIGRLVHLGLGLRLGLIRRLRLDRLGGVVGSLVAKVAVSLLRGNSAPFAAEHKECDQSGKSSKPADNCTEEEEKSQVATGR